MLEAAKTITTIRVRLPENGTYFTKTHFLPEKHLAVKPLFDLSYSKSLFGGRIDEVRKMNIFAAKYQPYHGNNRIHIPKQGPGKQK